MLRTLRVQDMAIIESLELHLEPGLNVITGETGAGKSILLQALDVALGGRPFADVVRTGAEEGVVEALFADPPSGARQVLTRAGLPHADEILVRRVVSGGGRTRAWVNGSLGSLAVLRELGPHLLHVYGQDEHQALRRVESHRDLLDAYGGLGSSCTEMRQRYERLRAAEAALEAGRAARQAADERVEEARAQHDELVRCRLEAGEEEALRVERSRLTHTERLAALVATASDALYSAEGSVTETLARVLGAVREAAGLDPELEPMGRVLEGALAEAEDVGSGLARYRDGLGPDPDRLEAIDERLAELSRLSRKYASTVDELIRRRDELEAELGTNAEGEDTVATLEAEVQAAARAAGEWAGKLSVERRRVARDLGRALVQELGLLALEGARFSVEFAPTEGRSIGPGGRDELEFNLSTNPGEAPRPLASVASGGELSRIMLALKCLTAQGDANAALIFDEVDVGVGGAVAEVIGRKLRHLGQSRQVLCVTHLPLIAAFADHHVAVAKDVQGGRTVSSAEPLSATERVAELARMMGGTSVSREAREHAEELLRRASDGGRRKRAGGNRAGAT